MEFGKISIERPPDFPEKKNNPEKKSEKLIRALEAATKSFERFLEYYGKKTMTGGRTNEVEKINGSRRDFLKAGAVGAAILVGGEVVEKFGKATKVASVLDRAIRDSELQDEETRDGLIDNGLEITGAETIKNEVEIKNIADHYLKPHDSLIQNVEYFPRELFSDNLLIAQEIQESNCDIEAESNKGAFGLMQTMEISIKDVSLFLERLHNNKVIEYDGPIYVGDIIDKIERLKKEYSLLNAQRENDASKIKKLQQKISAKSGVPQKKKNKEVKKPQSEVAKKLESLKKELKRLNIKKTNDLANLKKLEEDIALWRAELLRKKEKYGDRVMSDSDMVAMKNFVTYDSKYSRALGELYLMRLYHKKFGYGVGNDKFNIDHDISSAQTEILGAYNAGHDQIANKPIETWTNEPRIYVKRIFNLMERAENVRNALENAGLDRSNHHLVKRITLELNKVTTEGEMRKDILDKAMTHLISLVKDKEKEVGRKLKAEEVDDIFKELSYIKEINIHSFYS